MSQERWDVELVFLTGPFRNKGALTFQGPVIEIGKRPDAKGVILNGYNNIAGVHATIKAYHSSSVSITNIDGCEVRV